MKPGRGGVAAYVRAIERRWSGRSGRAVVLSPREWALLSSWHARGIPLALVEETIEAGWQRRSRRPPRNLSYVAAAVEEAWSVVVEGRVARVEEEREGAEAIDAWSQWRRVRDAQEAGTALRALLERLLDEAASGRPAATLDRELDRELPAALPAERVATLRDAAARQIEPYRERMPPGVAEATLARALLDRLRREIGLPRLVGEPDRDTTDRRTRE